MSEPYPAWRTQASVHMTNQLTARIRERFVPSDTNDVRAEYAMQAVEKYHRLVAGATPLEDADALLLDFFTDLFHLAARLITEHKLSTDEAEEDADDLPVDVLGTLWDAARRRYLAEACFLCHTGNAMLDAAEAELRGVSVQGEGIPRVDSGSIYVAGEPRRICTDCARTSPLVGTLLTLNDD